MLPDVESRKTDLVRCDNGHVFHRLLVCSIRRLEYDFIARVGQLWLEPYNCTDYSGAIALFQRIDPEVQRIETFAGSCRDIEYVRRADGKWASIGHGVL